MGQGGRYPLNDYVENMSRNAIGWAVEDDLKIIVSRSLEEG